MRKRVGVTFLMLIQLFTGISQTLPDKSVNALKALVQTGRLDTNRLSVFLQVSKIYLLGEKNTPPDLDSALKYAQQATALSQRLKNKHGEADSYILISRIFTKREDLAQGKNFAKKAIAIYSKNGSGKKLAESYMTLSESYEPYEAGLVEIIRLCDSAVVLFHKENAKEGEAAAQKRCGEMTMYQGKMEEGLKKLKQSLAIYQSIKYARVQEVYSLIGINYAEGGNYNEALKYGLLAAKTAEALKDTTEATAAIYNYLAVTYQRLGQPEDAAKCLKKAFVIAERGRDVPLIIMLATNIAHISLRLNKPDEALLYLKNITEKYPEIKDRFSVIQINSNFLKTYLHLKDYKNAGLYCEKLLAVSGKYPAKDPNQVIVYPFVCRYYFATNQYSKANKYLPLLKEICEKYNFFPDLRAAHLLWFQSDSAQGNYLSAISHYESYKTMNDSLFSEAKSKQISQLQIQYDTEKKDKDIQLLTKQGLLQNAQVEKANLHRNVTFAGAALLIIIIGLLYNSYRVKKRQQEEINQKNSSLQHLLSEKEWLLKEVHHRVKNNLQTVMSLLSSQSAYLQNDAALLAIKDSQHRVQAMSLIHQKLYNSGNFSTIDMPVYIGELVEYMRDSFSTGQRIRFDLNIESIELDVTQAVPVGLILNEAITNAIKYAFPEEREGVIGIKLQSVESNHCLLTISDNGIGMPEEFNTMKPGSLGLSLIKGLSQDLDGTFTLENNPGTVLKISFVPDTSSKRIITFTSLSSTLI